MHLQSGNKQNLCEMITAAQQNAANNAALTKSVSTPASLQTCVKFSGSNMTLQHKVFFFFLNSYFSVDFSSINELGSTVSAALLPIAVPIDK